MPTQFASTHIPNPLSRPGGKGEGRQPVGEVVQPRKTLHVLRDEPDNRILECALTAHAKMTVTSDRAMLDLGEYKGIRIVPPREFLRTIG